MAKPKSTNLPPAHPPGKPEQGPTSHPALEVEFFLPCPESRRQPPAPHAWILDTSARNGLSGSFCKRDLSQAQMFSGLALLQEKGESHRSWKAGITLLPWLQPTRTQELQVVSHKVAMKQYSKGACIVIKDDQMNRQPHNYVADHLGGKKIKSTFCKIHHPRASRMSVAKEMDHREAHPAPRSVWQCLRQAQGSQGGLQVSKSVLKSHFSQGHWPAGQRLVAGMCYHTRQQDNETTCKFCSLNSSVTLGFEMLKIANKCKQDEGLFCLYSFKQ